MRWTVLLGLCLLPATSIGCKPSEASAAEPKSAPRAVATARVTFLEEPRLLSYLATVDSARDAILATSGGGRVEAVPVGLGAEVRAGQVLVRMRDGEFKANAQAAQALVTQAEARTARTAEGAAPLVRSAEVALETARDSLTRLEALAAQGSASAQDLIRGRAEERSAQAQLEAARNDARGASALVGQARAQLQQSLVVLDERTVRSPFDGIVVTLPARVGDTLAPGAVVSRILDKRSRRFVFDVPQHEASLVVKEARVHLESGAVVARVGALSGGLSGEAHTRRVEAPIFGETDEGLFPGAKARVFVEQDARIRLAAVPLAAVLRMGGVARTFVLEAGHVVERLVAIQRVAEKLVYVREGLREGDVVVVAPPAGLRDGDDAMAVGGAP